MILKTKTDTHLNGKLATKYTYYVNSLGIRVYHGFYRSWYGSGEIRAISQYKYGLRHGKYMEWNNANILINHYRYYNDELHGIQFSYNYRGELMWEANYHYGKPIGFNKHYPTTYYDKDFTKFYLL